MLIEITENNGLETYVFEPRLIVAFNMMTFFNDDIGLEVESMTDYEPLYMGIGIGIDYEQNLRREMYYKKEFEKFGKKRPTLYIVK